MQQARVNYHVKSEHPQAYLFDVDGIMGNIVGPELVPTRVQVEDVRGRQHELSFSRQGICFQQHESQITGFETSTDWQSTYDEELRQLLFESIGAKEVIVFDHTLRIDDPKAERQPARNVHNDYSPAGAQQRLVDILGEQRAGEFSQGHFAFVNVWRPVERAIISSPLGFVYPESVSDSDWMNIELVYPERHGQILGVAENAQHQWFYLSAMTPQEVAIFNIYDNQGLAYLAHSALDMEDGKAGVEPRKSLESRTLVRY